MGNGLFAVRDTQQCGDYAMFLYEPMHFAPTGARQDLIRNVYPWRMETHAHIRQHFFRSVHYD